MLVGTEDAGGKTGEIKCAAGVGVNLAVALVPVDIPSHHEGVFVADPVHSATDGERLVAVQRRVAELKTSVVCEGDGGNTIVDRVGGNPSDAQFAGDVLRIGEGVRALRP